MKTVKKSDIKHWFPKRAADSRKGDNGRVLIVGGSVDFYGAPILAGLGALYSGCDLVYLCVPECNFGVTRSMYPDFIVKSYEGDYLGEAAISVVEDMALRAHSVLLGPGMGDQESGQRAVAEIISKVDRPIVLDAEAIQAVKQSDTKQKYETHSLTVTPHDGEFARLAGQKLPETPEVFDARAALAVEQAKALGVNILLKGEKDIVVSADGEIMINTTGNPGMSVGGTGDVLAGVVTSFIAQGLLPPHYACQAAAYIVGKTADQIAQQKGFCFSATDLALELPFTIHKTLTA